MERSDMSVLAEVISLISYALIALLVLYLAFE